MADIRIYNVVMLGIAFLLIFTAFSTCGNIEQTVVKSLNNATFNGSGYHSLGIIYGVFSFANLFAPSVVAVIGPQLTMFFSGILYSGYIAVFITPATWSFYLSSVLIGFGAALLWTAQGHFLVGNSDVSTINRNTGLFWALLQCSMLFGNLYVYLEWNGKTEISDRDRKTMFVALLILSVFGTLSFLILKKPRQEEDELLSEEEGRSLLSSQVITSVAIYLWSGHVTTADPALEAIKIFEPGVNLMVLTSFDGQCRLLCCIRFTDSRLLLGLLGTISQVFSGPVGGTESTVVTKLDQDTLLHLFVSKTILLLSFCMAYSGLEMSFYSGVYGTCIGATSHFGDKSKALIGISGILVGIGEIIGGGMFGLVLKNNRFRRTSVVFLGMVVHFVAFYLIFLNIPDDAPMVFETSTQHNPYLSPSVSIAMLCSFLLGLGDSCFNTQLYSILGQVYIEQSAPAFAIFKFVQSISAAVAFFYSGYLLLSGQLLIMVIMGFAGTLCFFMVERMSNVSVDLPEF